MSDSYRTVTGATISYRDLGSRFFFPGEGEMGRSAIIEGVYPVEESDNRDNWTQVEANIAFVGGRTLRLGRKVVAYLQDQEPAPKPEPDPVAVNEFRTRVLSSALKLLQARLFLDIKPNYNAATADAEYAQNEFDTYVRGFADVLESRDN